MATSIANSKSTIHLGMEWRNYHDIYGLQLLSTVVDSFAHQEKGKSHPISSKIPDGPSRNDIRRPNSSVLFVGKPTSECMFHSMPHTYCSLREKLRNDGKSKRSLPTRASVRNNAKFRRNASPSRSQLVAHLPPITLTNIRGTNATVPTLVPPSPPSYPQASPYKLNDLDLQKTFGSKSEEQKKKQQRRHLPRNDSTFKTNGTTKCQRTFSASVSKKALKVALVTNIDRTVAKRSMAELNYIKHKSVPMREKWMARFLELAEFKEKYGHTKVPHNFPESPKLAEWQKFQRQQRKLFVKGKHSQLTKERVAMLEKIGFVWEARIDAWESHYENLRRFKAVNGHVYVPVANTVLSQWVKRQRKQFKKYQKGQESSLTDDRVNRLNKLGFIWDGRHPSD